MLFVMSYLFALHKFQNTNYKFQLKNDKLMLTSDVFICYLSFGTCYFANDVIKDYKVLVYISQI